MKCSFCGIQKKDSRAMVATHSKEFSLCDKCSVKCKKLIESSRKEQKVINYV